MEVGEGATWPLADSVGGCLSRPQVQGPPVPVVPPQPSAQSRLQTIPKSCPSAQPREGCSRGDGAAWGAHGLSP